MVELVDTRDLKSLDRNIVPVQVRPRVPLFRAFVISINQLEHSEPYKIFIEKYHEALKLKQKHIEAVCIGSYSPEIKEVSSRYVNLKYIENNKWIFFTNYNSPKAKDFSNHEQISATFFWNEANIQIRLKGKVYKLETEASDKHFNSRSIQKNALALSSEQSKEISSYDDVIKKYKKVLNKIKNQDHIVRPDYWGGYFFIPYYFEFWEGSDFRLNKRISYFLKDDDWQSSHLQP